MATRADPDHRDPHTAWDRSDPPDAKTRQSREFRARGKGQSRTASCCSRRVYGRPISRLLRSLSAPGPHGPICLPRSPQEAWAASTHLATEMPRRQDRQRDPATLLARLSTAGKAPTDCSNTSAVSPVVLPRFGRCRSRYPYILAALLRLER